MLLSLASINIDIDPVLLQVGPLAFRWYGLGYVAGIVAGLWVALPYARRRGISEEQVWSVFWWAFIAGLVGARLYYVAQSDLGAYLAQPWRILATWEGGMAFYGAVFAAMAAIGIVCWREKIPFWALADSAALFASLGQAFGRIGNIINGDIVGYPTDLPWGFVYRHPGSFVADHSVAYLPAAAYELIFNLIMFSVLWSLRFRLRRSGMLFVAYLAIYSVGQFVLFFWRDNVIFFWGLKQAQLTALAVIVLLVPLWWWVKTHNAPEEALGGSKALVSDSSA